MCYRYTFIFIFRFHRFDHKIKAIKFTNTNNKQHKKRNWKQYFRRTRGRERDPDLIKAVELYFERKRLSIINTTLQVTPCHQYNKNPSK